MHSRDPVFLDDMSDATTQGELQNRILQLADESNWTELDEAWLEYSMNPSGDTDFYHRFIRFMRNRHQPEKGHGLILMVMETLAENERWEDVLIVAKAGAAQWPDSAELRKVASKGLKGLYGKLPEFSGIIGLCKGAPLVEAIERFQCLLELLPGNVFSHAYWGEGVVKNTDFSNGQTLIQFPDEERSMKLDFARKHLRHLHENSFLALRRVNPAKLKEIAQKDPAGLVRMMLQDGTLQQGVLKDMLMDSVIPEERWTSWWTKARHEIHTDPMVEFDGKGGTRAELKLREKPKTVEEEADELFLAPDSTLNDRIEAVEMLKKAGNVLGESVERLLAFINQEFANNPRLSASERIQLALLRDDIVQLSPDKANTVSAVAATREYVEQIPAYDLLLEFESDDYAIRAFRMLAERDGSAAAAQAAELFPRAPSKLAQVLWKEMEGEEHLQIRVQALRRLFDAPLENPETYAWTTRNIADHRWPDLVDHIPLSGLIPEMVDNLDQWHHMVQRGNDEKEELAAAKLLLSRGRALLQSRNFGPLCEAAEDMTAEAVLSLKQQIAVSDAFNGPFRDSADHHLLLARRDLKKPGQAETVNSQSEMHYCTPKARETKLTELRELNTVRIPANSKEIEKARSEGDLKENAGYIYAKEQQKMLMQQSLQLQQALQTATIFPRDKVNPEQVGFGVKFEVEIPSTGKNENYTVLGRFEADPDKHIVSYQAPFMQPFAGKKVGEEVQVNHPGGGETVYRIMKIEVALVSGEWE